MMELNVKVEYLIKDCYDSGGVLSSAVLRICDSLSSGSVLLCSLLFSRDSGVPGMLNRTLFLKLQSTGGKDNFGYP